MTEVGEIDLNAVEDDPSAPEVEAIEEVTTETKAPEPTTTHANGDINKNTEEPPKEAAGIACSLAPADSYVSFDRSTPVKIRFSGSADTTNGRPAISVMEFFEKR